MQVRLRTLAMAAIAAVAGVSMTARGEAQTVAEFYQRAGTLKLIISADPGGSYDSDGRLVARFWPNHIPGNPRIVVENLMGASGRVAANYLYNSAPKDGSVAGVLQNSLALGQVLGETGIQYDAARFNWIGTPVHPHEVLAVWHTSPVKSMAEAREREVVIGTTSATGMNFVYPKIAKELLGAKFKIVTGYAGGTPILLAMERGEVHGRGSNDWDDYKSSRPDWIRDKKIIPLFQMSLTKHVDLPHVPLMADFAPDPQARAIIEFLSIISEIGRPFLLPPGVPADRVAALRKSFDATMSDPAFLAEAKARSRDIEPIDGTKLAALVQRMLDTPKDTIQLLKASLSNDALQQKSK